MEPIISAQLYEVIKNDDKSDGISSYILCIMAVNMLYFVLMPSIV